MIPVNNNNRIPSYRDEHLAIDFDQQAAVLDSQRMILTRKEYDLLALLVQHAGEIIPREALLMRVWGYGADIRDPHARRARAPPPQKAGVFRGSIYRDHLRDRLPLPAVPRSEVL